MLKNKKIRLFPNLFGGCYAAGNCIDSTIDLIKLYDSFPLLSWICQPPQIKEFTVYGTTNSCNLMDLSQKQKLSFLMILVREITVLFGTVSQ